MDRPKLTAVARAVVFALLAFTTLTAPANAKARTTTTTTTSPGASRFYISGAGFGHGVGMSQYGAAGFALHGYRYGQILAHYYSGTTLAKIKPKRTVTVLLHEGGAVFQGATAIVGASKKPKQLDPELKYRVIPNGSKLRIATGRHLLGTFNPPVTVHGSRAPLTLVGQGAYDGAFLFRLDGTGGVMTVNSVLVDQYVRGVVTEEMPSHWPAQALDAQAVAARTYAIAAPAVTPDFDLYDDSRSQVYGPVSKETASGNAAVAATSGTVVEYGGRPAVTYFFSSSGGSTESIQNVWYGFAPEPWLRGVPDPYDNAYSNPYYRWLDSYTLLAAEHKLGTLCRGTLEGVKITETGVSPRVVRALVVGTGGTSTVTGIELQRLFAARSTYMSFATLTEKGERTKTVVSVTKKTTIQLSVQGTVYPAKRGQTVTAQRYAAAGWRSVARGHLIAKGSYAVVVKAPGTYRIVYEGLDGPNVRVP
jgi:stage II sporulation protein D